MKTEHIEKFIEDAIAGSYEDCLEFINPKFFKHRNLINFDTFGGGRKAMIEKAGGKGLAKMLMENYYKFLLSPEAWKAVGKTRGWKLTGDDWVIRPAQLEGVAMALYNRDTPSYWHNIFMQHVWEGMTTNDALGAISN